jgi:hypothetical protein
MQPLPSRTYNLTMPYHSMKPVPQEHRRAHERVRMELQDAGVTARQTLERADRWDRDWSDDLDPSPQRVHRTSDAYGEERSIEVNRTDNTVTYTIHETGEFATEPLGYQFAGGPSSSGGGTSSVSPGGTGPDGVYDEWDNSNRGGGPDSVYNEYDNGRGYTYSGPDGTYSYDPF